MQIAATVVFIVAAVMCIARCFDSETAMRSTVRIDRRVLDTGKGKRNG